MSDNPEAVETGKENSRAGDPGGKKGFRLFIIMFIMTLAIVGGVVASQQLPLLNLPWMDQEGARDMAETADTAMPVVTDPPAQSAAEEQPAATSGDIRELLEAMDGLRAELAGMSAAQSALRQSLHKQQQMNLQVRLRWISDPASRLPQIRLAWEEISLLTNLSDTERARAEEMQTLARDSMRKLRRWQDSLRKWADSLSVPTRQNILPEAGHPWLDRVIGQFRLYRAPSEESRQQARLRQKLLNVASQLALETWPTEGEWQELRAELLLQAESAEKAGDTDALQPDIPDNLEPIQADISLLQQTAREWLEQSS